MKDSALRQDILDELEFEPYIDANDIGVAVEDGIVTLTGHVPDYSQRSAVEQAVSRIKGVRGIAQNIEVRYPGQPGTADDEIGRRVVNTLKWSTIVPDGKVKVLVHDGWVTLSGQLEWNYQKTGAADASRNLQGVIGIVNNIELAPRPTSVDVRTHIAGTLKRYAEVEGSTSPAARSRWRARCTTWPSGLR
jgi:osmotically-inducible protein OsmY